MSDLIYNSDGDPFTIQGLIALLPEGCAFEVMAEGELMTGVPSTLSGLAQKLNNNEDQLHFLCMMARLGVRLFMTHLEYDHYHPSIPGRNELFHCRWLRWQGLLWSLVSIPAEDMENAIEACEASGVQIENGIPIVFHGGSEYVFPIHNCSSIVNVPGHPIYRQTPGSMQDERAMEQYRLHEYLLSKGVLPEGE